MANILRGQRPDITPAQVVSGIPILAELLHSFGVYNLSQAQQDSLAKAATWAFALIAGDTLLRIGRGVAGAHAQAAATLASARPAPDAALPVPPADPGAVDAAPADPGAVDAAPADPGAVDAAPADPAAFDDVPGEVDGDEDPPPGSPPIQPSQRPAVPV